MLIGPNVNTIRQFRSDAESLFVCSRDADGHMDDMVDGFLSGHYSAKSAIYAANAARGDTDRINSSHIGCALQSDLGSLLQNQNTIEGSLEKAGGSVSDFKKQFSTLVKALDAYTVSLVPGPTQSCLGTALSRLRELEENQKQADEKLEKVKSAIPEVGSNLSSAGRLADDIANDYPGRDVSWSGGAAEKALTEISESYASGQEHAEAGRTFQRSVTAARDQVLDPFYDAMKAADSENPTAAAEHYPVLTNWAGPGPLGAPLGSWAEPPVALPAVWAAVYEALARSSALSQAPSHPVCAGFFPQS